jgi:hypothetical protein
MASLQREEKEGMLLNSHSYGAVGAKVEEGGASSTDDSSVESRRRISGRSVAFFGVGLTLVFAALSVSVLAAKEKRDASPKLFSTAPRCIR